MTSFDYYGWNGCCLVCSWDICNTGIAGMTVWCESCLCKECSWYEHVPEMRKGFCVYPRKAKNTRLDEILGDFGIYKEKWSEIKKRIGKGVDIRNCIEIVKRKGMK